MKLSTANEVHVDQNATAGNLATQSIQLKLNRISWALLCSLPLMTTTVQASPWLEARDPFLRADLVRLSDAGQLSAPVNNYPLRWSTIGDDLGRVEHSQDAPGILRASRHVNYALNTARYGRGNRSFHALYNSEQPSDIGFGQFNRDQWGTAASYEHLANSFAFRLSTGYSKYNGEKDFTWQDSYLSLNSGRWLFSFGSLNRWWGQGWQHNLILGSSAQSVPELSVSYMGNNRLLGGWSIEALVGSPDQAVFDHHSAIRLVAKPQQWVEFGITYQTWFDGSKVSGSSHQLALDGRLSLPELAGMHHGLYSELASTRNSGELGAYLIGWSGQFDFALHSWRLVLEKLNSTDAKQSQIGFHNGTQWPQNSYPSSHKQVPRNSYPIDESLSAALYLQLENDHNLSLVYKDSMYNNDQLISTDVTYRLPALAGMVHLGIGYSNWDSTGKQTNLWTGYEFRF
ncbi:capsule assembly Wzi family protein [Vibrio sp.]|uniref:capsule assembly Wzi family protein n=1 Tax=Vibrio sp. TaxID=678 RepID=UPI003D11E06C